MASGLRSVELGPRSSTAACRASSMPPVEPPPLTLCASPSPTLSLPAAAKSPPEVLWLTAMDDEGDDLSDCEADFVTMPPPPSPTGPGASSPSRAATIGKKVLNPFCLVDSPKGTDDRMPPTRAELLHNKVIQRQKAAAVLARQQLTPRGTQPRFTALEHTSPKGKLAKLWRKLPSLKSKRLTGFEHGVRGDRVNSS